MCTELLEVRIGGRREENVSPDDGLLSQVAWIGQYREQQERDTGKMLKAVLRKSCQKLGWRAPQNIRERWQICIFSVNVLWGGTGCG